MFTQGELDALKAAYARGVLKVSYDGKETVYPNGADMLARIRVIEGELARAAQAPRTMAVFTTFRRD